MNISKMMRIVAPVLLVAATATIAEAVVLTFEGQDNTIYEAPIVRLGFELRNPVGQEQHFHEATSTSYSLPNNGTGILVNDRDTQIAVRIPAGLPTFTMSSVDVASAGSANNGSTGLTITGMLGAATTGSVSIPALGTGYTAVSGGALGLMDRLIFDGIGGGGGFVFDNLSVNQVPEPATLAVLGFAAAMGLTLRIPRTRSGR